MASCQRSAFSRQPASWNGARLLADHLLLARDLKLIKPKDHEELAQRATELKRMLAALLQKLNADRGVLKAPILKISSILGYG